jgi:hypothetical protein
MKFKITVGDWSTHMHAENMEDAKTFAIRQAAANDLTGGIKVEPIEEDDDATTSGVDRP